MKLSHNLFIRGNHAILQSGRTWGNDDLLIGFYEGSSEMIIIPYKELREIVCHKEGESYKIVINAEDGYDQFECKGITFISDIQDWATDNGVNLTYLKS